MTTTTTTYQITCGQFCGGLIIVSNGNGEGRVNTCAPFLRHACVRGQPASKALAQIFQHFPRARIRVASVTRSRSDATSN